MLLRTTTLIIILIFGLSNISLAAGGSIAHGDISVYKNGKLITKLSGKNPIEDGAFMVCESKCMIKSEGIALIGSDSAKIAVTNETDTFKLFVKEGRVDYVINNNVRTISFYTPQGTYTVAEVVFNASSTSVVKGSVVVDKEGRTEISVKEGRLIFATTDGIKTVDANNKIVLAISTPPLAQSDKLALVLFNTPPSSAAASASLGSIVIGSSSTVVPGVGTGAAIAGGSVVASVIGDAISEDINKSGRDTPAASNSL